MFDNARTNRFQLPDGVLPTFQGVASFTPGNRSPHVSGSQQMGGSPQDIRTADITPSRPMQSPPVQPQRTLPLQWRDLPPN